MISSKKKFSQSEYQKSSRSPVDSILEEAMKKVMEWKEHMDGHLGQ